MKHKGDRIFPSLVYHKSNPKFREIIDVEGLKPMKGDSYSCYSPEDSEPPAIFGYFGDVDYYDSTWDDDIWSINSENIEWYVDKAVGGDIQSAVVTYNSIERNKINLIYKGTGKSL